MVTSKKIALNKLLPHMRPFEDFQKHAMREAMDRVY